MKKILSLIVLSTLVFGIQVGDKISNNSYECYDNILYRHTGHSFGALYDYKTDRPFHCNVTIIGGFIKTKIIRIIKNKNLKGK